MSARAQLSAGLQTLVRRATVLYSVRSRRRKARRFSQIIADHSIRSVLLVGAESADFSWSNIVERAVIDSGAWVVASGLGPDLDFPVVRVLCDGLRLPFTDESFDLVISNAVIEHVGDAEAQATFVTEHRRVGRLLSRSEFRTLLPSNAQISGNALSPTFTAYYDEGHSVRPSDAAV